VPREETIAAFIAVFSELGYEPAYHAALESSFEKVALYAIGALPTHAARQLNYGWWTSKLGPSIDIEHELPESVVGGVYGEVAAILKRKRTT
jgi:hypothetical protein